ncbi:MAG: divalent-cation tolerance protein CutA [Rickettsiales bacterium]
MSDIWVLYSTFANKGEAVSVAEKLVNDRHIACANVHENITSIYRWEGQLKRDTEVVLFAKTQKNKVSGAIAAVKRLHSYEVPCIIAYPMGEGYLPYLQWVADETS